MLTLDFNCLLLTALNDWFSVLSYNSDEHHYHLTPTPANVCWSSRRLQYVFSVTIFSLPTRLKNVFKTFWRPVAKTSRRHLARRLEEVLKTCLEDVLKTYLEDVLKTCLEDVFKTFRRQTKCLLGISVSRKSKCVYLSCNKSIFNKSIYDKSKANPKCIN